jgi:hypothetical protein
VNSGGSRRCADRLRRRTDTRSRGSRGRSAVFGDHVHFRDGKAVLSSTRFVPDEVYVMAQMRFEIRTA